MRPIWTGRCADIDGVLHAVQVICFESNTSPSCFGWLVHDPGQRKLKPNMNRKGMIGIPLYALIGVSGMPGYARNAPPASNYSAD